MSSAVFMAGQNYVRDLFNRKAKGSRVTWLKPVRWVMNHRNDKLGFRDSFRRRKHFGRK